MNSFAMRNQCQTAKQESAMTPRLRIFVLTLFVFCLFRSAMAQLNPTAGIQMFSTQSGGTYDSVDLANSNIHISIPVRSKAGKIPFSYVLQMDSGVYDAACYGQPHVTTNGWVSSITGASGCGGGSPTGGLSGVVVGTFGAGYTTTTPVTKLCNGMNYNVQQISGFYITDSTGGIHPVNPQSALVLHDPCYNSSLVGLTTDGSGYTLSAKIVSGNLTWTAYSKSGLLTCRLSGNCGTSNALQDADGTSITTSISNNQWTYADTLGQTALTGTNVAAGNPLTYQYTYTDQSGNPQTATFQQNFSPYTQQTAFGCSQIQDIPARQVYLVSSLSTPLGNFTFSYESTPGNPANTTGRLAGITFPTGGSVSYTYSGGNNGIYCNGFLGLLNESVAGLVPTLTRTENDGQGHTSTWTYVMGTPASNVTVTKTDPAGNQTIYSFGGEFQTQSLAYQGGCPTATPGCNGGGTLLRTTVTCYNAHFTNCSTAWGGVLPVTQTDVYTSLNGSPSSLVETKFDTYGNTTYTATYDYNQTAGAAPSGTPLKAETATYASPGNYIYDKPASVVVAENGATSAQTTYTNYTPTGHVGTVSSWSGWAASGWLSDNYTYKSNGTIATKQDVNGALYTYAYNGTGGCNSLLPTSVTVTGQGLPSNGLTSSTQWDCNGGVVTQTIDPNQQPTVKTYNDPMWRLTSAKDPTGATTTYDYISPTVEEASLPVTSNSAVDTVTTVDGLGRTIFKQERQAPGSSNFDSVQYGYTWNSTGAVATVSMPYVGTQGQAAPTGTKVTTTQYEALGRTQSVVDGGGGALTNTYSKNDLLQVISPPAQNENVKQKQFEYDGLGRLTSVCEITTSLTGYGTCGQTNTMQGYYTTYSYPLNQLIVTQNAQSASPQTRQFSYDEMGRLYKQATPEGGTDTYYYDSANGYGCPTSVGDIVESADNAGNVKCYGYDAMHRPTSVTYAAGPNMANSVATSFVYDSSTFNCPSGSAVLGNVAGRLAEAYTGSSGSKVTDLGYCYSGRGETTDVFESTPHSGGYYHASTAYFANGVLQSLSGVGKQSAYTYGVDGEGRADTTTQGSTNFVTGTTYNAGGQPLTVSLDLGDSDTYTYDPNTGRMASFTYTVGSTPKSLTGNLTWNANGSLAQLAITDGFNSVGTQTWNYGSSTTAGYDDIGRLISAVAGSSWSQSFSYDPFGNITKSGSISWMPGYSQSTNQYTLAGTSYDANGNLLNDTFYQYIWNADGKPVTIAPSAGSTVCGGTGVTCLTYDALGRMAEKNVAGTYSEVEYSPVGKSCVMNGQSTQLQCYVPLPGGEILSPGPDTFWHADWLGTVRLGSSASQRTISFDRSFAPFGELISISGGTTNADFTGLTQDTISGEYDTPNRELAPTQGRWLSPDPAGLGSVDLFNPQSWNRYTYVGNIPTSITDPTGLGGKGYCPYEDSCEMWGLHRDGDRQPVQCFMDDGEVPCRMVASVFQNDPFEMLQAENQAIRLDEEGGYEQLAGWTLRNQLFIGGDHQWTWKEEWVDYDPAGINGINNLMLSLSQTDLKTLGQTTIGAYHPFHPTFNQAAGYCTVESINENNGLGLPTDVPTSGESVAPITAIEQKGGSVPLGSTEWVKPTTSFTMNPNSSASGVTLGPLAAPAIGIQSSYAACMHRQGY